MKLLVFSIVPFHVLCRETLFFLMLSYFPGSSVTHRLCESLQYSYARSSNFHKFRYFSFLSNVNLNNPIQDLTYRSSLPLRCLAPHFPTHVPRYNLQYAKKGFSYSALKVWNEIPLNIRELPTLCRFKKQLKIHLMS